jgi:4'-phosphopantetheinyl transferase
MKLPALWVAPIPLSPPPGWESVLPESERLRHASMKSAKRQSQFLAGRLLLRRALESALGKPASSFDISAPKDGAPYLENGPTFSISHCNGMAACLISDEPCGMDVEDSSVDRDFAKLAAMLKFPENPGREKFYELWTEKEARFKAGEPCAWMGRMSWNNYRLCMVTKSKGVISLSAKGLA